MKINFLVTGKTTEDYLRQGISIYEKRIKHYIGFEYKELPELKNTKNLTFEQQKTKEEDIQLKNIKTEDDLILLDENGKSFNSVEFAKFLDRKISIGSKNLVFLVGGPYGFSSAVYTRANERISLSKLTFSHQMVRLIFIEQLYRGLTILKGEPYHHE